MDVLLFQDPTQRAMAYLGAWVPAESGPFLGVPPNWGWDQLLVTVVDTGGRGERDVVLDDARLTVEVSHPDAVRASEVARNLHAIIRQWPFEEKGVIFLRTLQRPTFQADAETRTPGYSFTVELSFRASATEITAI